MKFAPSTSGTNAANPIAVGIHAPKLPLRDSKALIGRVFERGDRLGFLARPKRLSPRPERFQRTWPDALGPRSIEPARGREPEHQSEHR